MVFGNITKKIQILSTSIHGDLLHKHKMSKKTIWDISLYHKMMQVIIPMVAEKGILMLHMIFIQSYHHLTMLQQKAPFKTYHSHKLPIAKESQSLSPCSKDLRRRKRSTRKNKRTLSKIWKCS
ncbi:hypothetical protein AHAS_Ahas10G0144100 [Arachis hypogaea]